jgi:ELWxxDGT repeat protein
MNDTLYFTAQGRTGRELWKSDGSSAGTVLVNSVGAPPMLGFEGTLYFSAGSALWKSDGTAAGTVAVKTSFRPSQLKSVGKTLFLAADDGETGEELWKSDGTSAGTVLVRDVWPGSPGSTPVLLASAGGLLFSSAVDPTHGMELWRSNGTSEGTFLLRDINPEIGASEPRSEAEFKGALYFAATDTIHGTELWRTDLTTGETVLFKDIQPGPDSTFPFGFTVVDEILFFVCFDDGLRLWKSDATGAGTVPLHTFFSWGPFRANVGGILLFVADDGTTGQELWASDGTAAGTRLVKDIAPGRSSPFSTLNPNLFAVSGGVLFFTANAVGDPFRRELWRSDGTSAGTYLVKNINLFTDAFPYGLTDVNGTLFFFAADFTHGFELWKSDGTEAGTVLVKDINPGQASSPYFTGSSGLIVNAAGTAYFGAYDGAHGFELWKSDGTEAGTVLVKDIAPGPTSSSPFHLCAVGKTVFFAATEGQGAAGLWKTDGTEAGTVLLNPVFPTEMIDAGGFLVFNGSEGLHGQEVWISDGTVAGTRMLADVSEGPSSFSPSGFVRAGPFVFFSGDDGRSGRELWAFRAAGRDLARPGSRVPGPVSSRH